MKPMIKGLAVAGVAVPLALAVAGSAPTLHPIAAATLAAAPYSVEQRAAARRAFQAEAHPQWRTLSAAGRLERMAFLGGRAMRALGAGTPAPAAAAAFEGNQTLIKGPSGRAIELRRQADCSLSYSVGSYTVSLTAPTVTLQSTTANYQNVLHAAAGLSTTANAFPRGCAEPTLGIGSRRGFYLGRTTQNLDLFASTGYHATADSDALFYVTVDPATLAVQTFNSDLSVHDIGGMTAGDLNGDGRADIAVLNMSAGSVTVWITQPNGSLGAPTTYTTTGTRSRAAVMTDVNGDGKVDLVVAGSTFNAGTSRDEQSVAVLLGRGDGTFEAARSFAITSPSLSFTALLTTLAAVDLRGTGRPDIVGSNGLVLLNDGSGGYTQAPTWGFPAPNAANSYGPTLATGDFNEDGKSDVVVNTGSTVQIYLGRGDGTFTTGRAYANNDSVGYMTATDLDGDGHLDLYIGLANGGYFVGDQYGVNQAYALMGRGDGSFAGAPVLPFVYNGHNLVDLNRDGVPDGVGANADRSFSTYLGDTQGGYAVQSTLSVASLTFGGQAYALNDIDSFDLADINGDGVPDLVFLGRDFVARNSPSEFYTPGVLIALGDGHGGFSTPSFMPAPSFVPSTDIDIDLKLSNMRLADVNGDGKADMVYAYADTGYYSHQRTIGTAVQLGNGDGTFQAPKTFVSLTGPDNGSFINHLSKVQQFVDLNHDGRLDLVIASETNTLDTGIGGYRNSIQVALGLGDGTFSTPTTVAGPEVLAGSYGQNQPTAAVIADMNGDGVPDLVVLGGSTGYSAQIAIALGSGDGTFKAPSRTTLAAQYLGGDQQIAVADFNGDGKLDVLFANPFGTTGIIDGAGDGTLAPLGSAGAYTPNLTISVPVGGATYVADLNHDARPDVITGDVLLMSTAAAVAPPPAAGSFSLSAASSGGTVTAGQSVQAALTLTPGGGFNGTVSFSCAGLPSGATCRFEPASVNVSGAAASTTLTISTTAAASLFAFAGRIDPMLPGALMLAGLGIVVLRRGQAIAAPVLRRWGLVAVMATGGLALSSCGGGDDNAAAGGGGGGGGTPGTVATPAGSYTVVVTATDGSVSRSINYTLAVN